MSIPSATAPATNSSSHGYDDYVLKAFGWLEGGTSRMVVCSVLGLALSVVAFAVAAVAMTIVGALALGPISLAIGTVLAAAVTIAVPYVLANILSSKATSMGMQTATMKEKLFFWRAEVNLQTEQRTEKKELFEKTIGETYQQMKSKLEEELKTAEKNPATAEKLIQEYCDCYVKEFNRLFSGQEVNIELKQRARNHMAWFYCMVVFALGPTTENWKAKPA